MNISHGTIIKIILILLLLEVYGDVWYPGNPCSSARVPMSNFWVNKSTSYIVSKMYSQKDSYNPEYNLPIEDQKTVKEKQ